MNFVRMKNSKTIGILGGMGPEATSYLFNLIIKNTRVKRDQDHIPVIIYNYPQIPDRTLHLVEKQESPLPYLVKGMKLLESAGASFVLMPCNTAHYYIGQIGESCKLPVLNMISLTCQHIHNSSLKKAGILATTGTVKTGLYQKELESLGIEVVLPTPAEQKGLVMEAVYGKRGVKAGYKREPKQLLKEAAGLLEKRGAGVIIAGCTEIPIVLNRRDINIDMVNPMEILAKKAIEICTTV